MSSNASIAGTVQGTDATLDIRPTSEGLVAGNARGENSVDLQTVRSAATQVASGYRSVIVGGAYNTAANLYASILGGYNNTASGDHSFVGGGGYNTASGLAYSVVCGGTQNTAGGQNTVVCGGQFNNATGSDASILGGANAVASLQGQIAHAAGRFVANGDAQTSELVARRLVAEAGPNANTQLTLDGGAPGASNRLVLPANTTWAFEMLVVARNIDTDAENAVFQMFGGIKRDGTAASTALIGTVDQVKKTAGGGSAAWDITVTANTTDGALQVQATGEAAHNIRGFVTVRLSEVAG